jgi:hypothetical protein
MNDNGPQAREGHLSSRERAHRALTRMDDALAHWARHGHAVLTSRHAAGRGAARSGPGHRQDHASHRHDGPDFEQPLPELLRARS